MARILIVTVDGGGNVPPAIAIGAALERRGHRVRFLGHPHQAPQIEGAGLRFEPFERARPFSRLVAKPTLLSLLQWPRLGTDPGIGEDLLAAIDREPVDAVVIDCLLPGSLRVAKRTGLPVVLLLHSLSAFWLRQWSPPNPVGLWNRLRGVSPLGSKAALVLLPTLAELDPIAPGATRLADEVAQTGPALPSPPVSEAAPRDERPTILVSLSTASFAGQDAVLQRVLDAIGALPVQAIVTTGAIDPAELRAPANAELLAYARHEEVMPRVTAVVGHGGHATTMLALAHGLPLVILPLSPMLDQPLVASRVAAEGAAIRLSTTTPVAGIRAAIERVLADPGYREAASRLGRSIRDADGAADAASRIESLVVPETRRSGPPTTP